MHRTYGGKIVGVMAMLLVACWSCRARGAEAPTTAPSPYTSQIETPAPLGRTRFPVHTWCFHADGAFAAARTNPRFEQLQGGEIGLEYFFARRMSIETDLPVYWINQTGNNAIASGFTLLARGRLYEKGGFSFYLDGGAGLLYSHHQVPQGGTRINFTPQIGVGTTWMLDDHTYLIAGARLLHLSNAGIEGTQRNPSIDGSIMGYVGIGWKF